MENQNGLARRDFLRLAAIVAGSGFLASCGLEPKDQDMGTKTVTVTPSTPETSGSTVTPSASPMPTETSSAPIVSSSPTETSASPTLSNSPTETSPTPTPSSSRTTTKPPSSSATKVPPATTRNLPADHFIEIGPSDRPNVSITVDDFFGLESADYLTGLLKLGRQKNTKFTLFPTGASLQAHYDAGFGHIWRQAVAEGHVVGNHTWDHDTQLATRTAARIAQDLEQQRQIVAKILGSNYDEFLMRPPGGSGGYHNGDPNSQYEKEYQRAIAIIKKLGYWMTMWSTDSNDEYGNMITPGDGVRQQDNRFLSKIFNGVNGNTYERVRNGSIILVHPTTLSINGMSRLIDGLHARRYNCVTVPELFP